MSCSQVVLPLLSIPYVARILDPAAIGQVSFIDSFTYYFITIAEFGIIVYGIREVAREKDNPVRLNKLVSELITLHLLSSVCAIVLYAIGVMAVWDKIRDVRLLWFSFSFLIVNSFACEWYFIGRERFRYISLRSLLVRVLGLASIFILVRQPDDYYLYYGIMVISSIVISLWNNVLLFREIKFSFRELNLKRHLRYVWVTWSISLVYSITLMLDVVLLRLVSNDTSVGIYSFAMKIVKTVSILVTDSLIVFFPRIVALRNEQSRSLLQQKLLQNVQLIIAVAIPMGAGLYLLADEIVLIFMGEKFLPVAADLRLLVLFPFLKGYNLFLGKQVLLADNREKTYLFNLIISSVFFIASCLILSTHYADKGTCIAILLAEAIFLLLNFYAARKTDPQLRIFDASTAAYSLVASALFIPFIYAIRHLVGSATMVLLISLIGCVLIYVLFQLYIARNSLAILIKSSVLNYISRVFRKKESQ